jgi:predicted ATP-dependent endonuclease of OLD family
MNLNSIEISNYKSIKNLKFEVKKIDNNFTYCLFGINESGKSSILKAISLFENDDKIKYPEDFFSEEEIVEITFYYTITDNILKNFHNQLLESHNCPKEILSKIIPIEVQITSQFDNNSSTNQIYVEEVKFKNNIVKGYCLQGRDIIKKTKDSQEEDLDLINLIEKHFSDYFLSFSHSVIFWESTDKYLILDNIDLTSFASTPESVSIPLYNCFLLAGIKPSQISKKITELNSPARIRNLESLLSKKVTEHIKSIWKDHPIKILFEIDKNKISLLIEDEDVEHKAKTTSQRSDGFKQFISFLLTISADDKNQSLEQKILLIDEPETHLHPQAQINLKDELIKITKNHASSIVIYATHSNYLIDKNNLNRNFKVFKENNETTTIDQIKKTTSSYSEVNYEVFDIPTTDYHNELYGYLEDAEPAKLNGLPKDRQWENARNHNVSNVSLPEYIRHSIHHPENQLNKKYSEIQLKKSIKTLRKLKYGKE